MLFFFLIPQEFICLPPPLQHWTCPKLWEKYFPFAILCLLFLLFFLYQHLIVLLLFSSFLLLLPLFLLLFLVVFLSFFLLLFKVVLHCLLSLLFFLHFLLLSHPSSNVRFTTYFFLFILGFQLLLIIICGCPWSSSYRWLMCRMLWLYESLTVWGRLVLKFKFVYGNKETNNKNDK